MKQFSYRERDYAFSQRRGGEGLVQPGSTCAAKFSLFPCFL
jgi:hypothetical protein